MTLLEDIAPFRTFILKVANRCNIDCDYCFVFNSKDQVARRLPARMDLDVARATARRIGEHVTAHSLPAVHVVLHGGEPLLAGARHMADLLDAVRDGSRTARRSASSSRPTPRLSPKRGWTSSSSTRWPWASASTGRPPRTTCTG